MTYRVEIAAQVDSDAAAILEWFRSQHATDAAVAWFRGLGAAIDSLAQFPILAEHPEVASGDIYTAALLGDHEAVARFLAEDPANATVQGGPRNWDAL